jgi:hypothetical protein
MVEGYFVNLLNWEFHDGMMFLKYPNVFFLTAQIFFSLDIVRYGIKVKF